MGSFKRGDRGSPETINGIAVAVGVGVGVGVQVAVGVALGVGDKVGVAVGAGDGVSDGNISGLAERSSDVGRGTSGISSLRQPIKQIKRNSPTTMPFIRRIVATPRDLVKEFQPSLGNTARLRHSICTSSQFQLEYRCGGNDLCL